MSRFPTHSADTAPEAAKPFLEKAAKAYGFTPNLLATMATAPVMLEAYMTLAGIFGKTDLSETERQIILMTNNRLNGCTYCMAAHSTIAEMSGVPAEVIAALRDGTAIADPKLEALRQFSITINETRGWPEPSAIDALVAAGYTSQTALEVVLGTGLKVLSNYTNHIAETTVDEAFAKNQWANAA
ncbi:MAG: carboxymuconolactone decarboxylase family protein [Pseudomonadota bacterium]